MIVLIVAISLSYLLGSVPTSYIIAKSIKGIDIRKYGSGNVGATNVLRTLGKRPALIALIIDILKGIAAVTVLSTFFYHYSRVIDYESFRILLGLAVISGHIWTLFLKFQGGKGVATSTGVLLILYPKVLGIAAIVWFITVVLTRYVSLGSILASVSLPITAAIMGKGIQTVLFAITLCIISSYKHRANIVRLMNREETKIGEKVRINE